MKRNIVSIDDENCNGCGECIPNCAEGAIKIIDGKAKLLDDKFCDGLGACLGHCPQDAIRVIERDAQEFDEEAVKMHLNVTEEKPNKLHKGQQFPFYHTLIFFGCFNLGFTLHKAYIMQNIHITQIFNLIF
jgi:MinD superfamily P-loop ATPase